MPLALRASFRPVARMTVWRVGTGRCGPGARGATSAVSMVTRRHAVAGLPPDLTLHKSHGVALREARSEFGGYRTVVRASELVVRFEPPASRGRLVRATARATGGAPTATVGRTTTHPPDSHQNETPLLRSRLRRPPRRSRPASVPRLRVAEEAVPVRYPIADSAFLYWVAIRRREAVKYFSGSWLSKGAAEALAVVGDDDAPATIGRSIDCARQDRLPSRSLMKN
jgi:hypothetical protein